MVVKLIVMIPISVFYLYQVVCLDKNLILVSVMILNCLVLSSIIVKVSHQLIMVSFLISVSFQVKNHYLRLVMLNVNQFLMHQMMVLLLVVSLLLLLPVLPVSIQLHCLQQVVKNLQLQQQQSNLVKLQTPHQMHSKQMDLLQNSKLSDSLQLSKLQKQQIHSNHSKLQGHSRLLSLSELVNQVLSNQVKRIVLSLLLSILPLVVMIIHWLLPAQTLLSIPSLQKQLHLNLPHYSVIHLMYLL
ncbi:hypothetical protein MGS_04041 [Candida albicans P78042]|nr:hypothetical protein MGS_04041 [Candida albicans P78042]